MNPTKYSVEYLVAVIVSVLLLNAPIQYVGAELTPPYFNLAEGRHISATATCGVGTDGPELYCKLVGANTEHDNNQHKYELIQGQVCDYCDPTRPDRAHPPEYAIDGTSNFWQSPPLSRGMKYNEVNLTIDFGQEFHVAYLFIRMGNSPRPGLWTLEKSSDYGKTWTPWQHFSDTPADCETFFGRESLKPITKDDDVICTTEYSKIVPLEDGEIPVMLLNNRPSANNYFNSTVLQEWTRATNVRFRFYRTKNLLGHLMSVARQDPTVTRRYFYSIKDISIGGRCRCNGHADTCDVLDAKSPTRLLACLCRHHTAGIHCNECEPGFEQKKWRQNTKAHPFQCEPCNCHGHSNDCVYDEEADQKGLSLDIHGRYEGGGVCQNCQHNTEGINCNKCESKYYRPYGKYWNETDVCQPCNCDKPSSTGNCEEETGRCECRVEFQEPDCTTCSFGHFGYPNCRPCECNINGTEGYYCESSNGICPCKPNYAGDFCERCAEGFYGPDCLPCDCDLTGSLNNVCDEKSGQCLCSPAFDGKHCDRCKDGYFGYPDCKYCNCDLQGTEIDVCNKDNGTCLCREGYETPRCDQCLPGYYGYPECVKCNCSTVGSNSFICDATGKCPCLTNFAGKQCTLCSAGYYDYPQCLYCNCSTAGSNGISCNSEGQCTCLSNFDGQTCRQCKEGFYNYPACEECNCDPAGVTAKFSGCGNVPPGGELCQCKERVTGRICNECKPLYWNLNITNHLGCDECDCFTDGTVGTLDTCNSKTGQCHCKPSVNGRICNECKDGTFDLVGGNLFGCKDCKCDIGGSIDGVCNKETGQCNCHPRITGRTCSETVTTHYYPTLHQNQFEFEDGYTPSGTHVRYEFDESQFPGFSKRGYAKFTSLQSELINEVDIKRSSVYRIVIRYVNPTSENVIANIVIKSDNPIELDQNAKVLFKPTTEPQFVTVSGAKGDIPSPIVLDPGRYTISVKTDKYLYLDYFVLLPAAYYEASILTKKIENPCEVGDLESCRHYKYPSIDDFGPVTRGFNADGEEEGEVYTDDDHLNVIKSKPLPLLNELQQSLTYITNVPAPGKYVVVVDYVTERRYPESYDLKVKLLQSDQPEGFVSMPSCLYTTVCRQPVIDDDSKEQIFTLAGNQQTFEISGDAGTHVAIKSITAIPIQEWSLDLITPSPVCVMKDGSCTRATFLGAPDSKKIEFESFHEAAENNPLDINNNDTQVIYCGPGKPTIEIKGKVPSPARYNILVKFYQPNHAKFDLLYKIDADKLSYDGKVNLRNCPSNSGCRELILQNNGAKSFDLEENVTITFTNTHQKGVWLDYVLIIAEGQFNDNLLEEETIDQTKDFIQKCGQDHYYIQLNASDFCKQAVFSLTADYNSGALPCMCDYEGSTSFECDPFGGQCQCKPNIIGRQCDACRTGYYGFPDCKPCDCPSKSLCEKDTGACICPPHVTGEKCDKCEPYSFGFDQFFGCELCNCDPLGVQNNELQCDLYNGSCACRPNIEGRKCDHCFDGYFNFPHCQPCRCSIEGTTLEICDKQDETCFCKKNVQGQMCDRCVDGTYNLQKSNPEGCTKCFCFGKTTRCQRAYLRPFNVSMMRDVSVNTILLSPIEVQIQRWPIAPQDLFINETTIETDLKLKKEKEELVYFGALDYLEDQSNHLTAYGGSLTYTLYTSGSIFYKAFVAPDVILEGKDLTITHQSYQQPANEQNFYGSVKMVESSFSTTAGTPVTRDQFMHVLNELNAIYIRATYWTDTFSSQLSDVYLSMADEDEENYNLYEELSVEQCHCPPGYVGNSCEDCAPGYYRDPNGPHGGYCVPCNCNNHADSCDLHTGICQNCKHSTMGDHCEQCIVGYHGNATNGQPNDCMICACPLPIDSNNFATGCEISEDGYKVHCTCREGYTGEKCQGCAQGFYGQPTVEGQVCQPCQCSGNIDPNEEGSCDSVSGECLKCRNNTFGVACNFCAPFYYGDAVMAKDCQSCICDRLGTEHCDSYTGNCHCHPNVIGSKCDRCEPDHYGFESGRGCTACDCAVASNSTQCDDNTGECRCKPGVTGRQCDRCLPGYWNYTSEGCLSCSCNNDYSRGVGCNVYTGQCECLPGVVGEKCDSCPYRWVLVQDRGCHECDVCHHSLLDVTDSVANELDPVIVEFQTVAGGFFTSQKLKYLDELADKIEPDVRALDPTRVNLTPLTQSIETLESEAKNFERKLHYNNQTINDQLAAGSKLLDDSRNVHTGTRKTLENIQNTVYEVQKVADSIDTTGTTKAEAAISEANTILNQLKDFAIDTTPTENQLKNSIDYLEKIENFVDPVQKQNDKLNSLRSGIDTFNDKLKDLKNHANDAIKLSMEAGNLHYKNKNGTVNSKFDTVNNHTKETENNIAGTSDLKKQGDIVLGEIFRFLKNLENVNNQLKSINSQVEKNLPEKEDEYDAIGDLIANASNHRSQLADTAEQLKNELSNIAANSEQSLKAAHAYSDIADAINEAKDSSKNSKLAANNATDLSVGIDNRAGISDKDSRELLEDARNALGAVQTDLQPHINNATATVKQIQDLNAQSDEKIVSINMALLQIPEPSEGNTWEDSRTKVVEAKEQASDAKEMIQPILSELESGVSKAKQLSKNVDDTNLNIAQAGTQIDRISKLLPNLQSIADNLKSKQDATQKSGNDLAKRIEKLKTQIDFARDLANSIKVGVRFHPNTTLELQPPASLAQQSNDFKTSLYFRTNQTNGFLLYLGNENKRDGKPQGKQEDYMALEIENGYPILAIDLGNGPDKIISKKNVANGKWHQAIVERTGDKVKLSIREEIEDGKDQLHEIEERLSSGNGDDNNIFDLSRENSKIFVGGYPPEFNVQDDVKYSSFEGEIEDLRVGDERVGLWNFVDGQNNNDGARERDELVASEVQPTGYRFGGHGHVTLDARPYSFKQRSNIKFRFKASRDTTEGLMFFAGRDNNFISIELIDGSVWFKYKLGQHLVSIGSNEQFNDDEWHWVEAERNGRAGVLKVDNNKIYQEESPVGSEENLKVSDEMYFGGHSDGVSHPDITDKSFDGCIDNVYINGNPVTLSRNLKAYGVRPGCSIKFSTVTSYPPGQPGYLRQTISPLNSIRINLKFKTKQNKGLIFYVTDSNQQNTLGLSIENGALSLRSPSTEVNTQPNTYNDSEWHHLSLLYDGNRLSLTVDDDAEQSAVESYPIDLNLENVDIYYGGLPAGFPLAQYVPPYFVGCISDVYVNGQISNFAQSSERKSALLDSCARDLLDYDPAYTPLIYPGEDVQSAYNRELLEKQRKEQEEEERRAQAAAAASTTPPPQVDLRNDFDETNEIESNVKTVRPNYNVKPQEYLTTSTTVRPTRRRPNKQDPICKLPADPEYDVGYEAGYRFGTTIDSRIEYTDIPAKFRKGYELSLEFKTDKPDGVLFYAADSRHTDFIVLFLLDGYVYHTFNCGSGSANMTSKYQYNNNAWHTVVIRRQQSKGTLLIDGGDEVNGESSGNTRVMTLQAPYSFGGVNPNLMDDLVINSGIDKSKVYRGCIRNIQVGGQPWGAPQKAVGVYPCSEQVEEGVFFGGGFVKLKDRFKVGADLTISFDIKPRTLNGLLLSVYGRNAMFALQLINGTINLTVNNGDGPFTAIFQPENGQNFCDGDWHTVTAVKSQYVITLVVDSINSLPTIGSTTAISTDTTRPLFLGGHPHIGKAKGLTIRRPFIGCIRNIKIREAAQPINLSMAHGNVQTGVCPLI